MRWIIYVLILVTLVLLIASRLYPETEKLEVVGNIFLSEEKVLELAGLAEGHPLFWVNPWTLRKLSESPWISRARVFRNWPDRAITVEVWERQPLATDGTTVWAKDGKVLPDVPSAVASGLVQVRGWGESRIGEALDLLQLLAEYEPKVLSYTPEGFEIQLVRTVVLTPSVADLKEHWSAFMSHTGNRIAVYAWGVSIDND
jgi:cell division septal protein FtsQ